MFPNIIVQALKLVTIVENWIPLPTGPFGDSALSSGLMQLQNHNIRVSASQFVSTATAHMEAEIRLRRDLAAMAQQFQTDYTNYFELIESHRPLNAHESQLWHVYELVVEAGQSVGAWAEATEQRLASILSGSGAEEGNSTMDLIDVMDANHGMGLFVL